MICLLHDLQVKRRRWNQQKQKHQKPRILLWKMSARITNAAHAFYFNLLGFFSECRISCLTNSNKYCRVILTSSFLVSSKAQTLPTAPLSVLLSGYDAGECGHLCQGAACCPAGGPAAGCLVPHRAAGSAYRPVPIRLSERHF